MLGDGGVLQVGAVGEKQQRAGLVASVEVAGRAQGSLEAARAGDPQEADD
jgi:hypothetical protein